MCKAADIFHQKCSSDGQIALETPSPQLFVSDHFCNFPKLMTGHSHGDGQRAEVRQGPGFELFSLHVAFFFHFLDNCYFSCEQPSATLNVFKERLEMCTVTPCLNNILSPPLHDGWLFTPSSSVAARNMFCLLMWTDITSYELPF